LVLVFALAQGLFWIGIGSTFLMALGTSFTVAAIATIAVWASGWAKRFAGMRGGLGTLAMRAIEVGAALLVTAFGLLLLGGYLVNERMIGF
jgi:nickel/cobalt exporter